MTTDEQSRQKSRATDEDGLGRVRVVVRPLGNPLPLGFLALMVATVAFATVQLGLLPVEQGRVVAAGVLVLTVPLQLGVSGLGFLARDPVAGTGMGVLAGTWAAVAVATLLGAPGATSPALGVLLVCAALAMLVPTVAATTKLAGMAVMGLSALRFAVTGVGHLTGSTTWLAVAGWVGLALGLLALYAALAFELEDVRQRAVLPVGRRGSGADVMSAPAAQELAGVAHQAGVRQQL